MLKTSYKKEAGTRQCRLCKGTYPVSQFNIGPGGRIKSICASCLEALFIAYYGSNNISKCATCGRLTIDYRCKSCWKKMELDNADGTGLDANYI